MIFSEIVEQVNQQLKEDDKDEIDSEVFEDLWKSDVDVNNVKKVKELLFETSLATTELKRKIEIYTELEKLCQVAVTVKESYSPAHRKPDEYPILPVSNMAPEDQQALCDMVSRITLNPEKPVLLFGQAGLTNLQLIVAMKKTTPGLDVSLLVSDIAPGMNYFWEHLKTNWNDFSSIVREVDPASDSEKKDAALEKLFKLIDEKFYQRFGSAGRSKLESTPRKMAEVIFDLIANDSSSYLKDILDSMKFTDGDWSNQQLYKDVRSCHPQHQIIAWASDIGDLLKQHDEKKLPELIAGMAELAPEAVVSCEYSGTAPKEPMVYTKRDDIDAKEAMSIALRIADQIKKPAAKF